MKTTEDFRNKAFFLLTIIAREHMDIELIEGRIVIKPKPGATNIIASELLEIYTDGWDHRSINL